MTTAANSAISNNKISNIISSQVPFFVRNEHPNFVAFLEAYYEFLEQRGQTIDTIKNLKNYKQIDTSIDGFVEHLYTTYMKLIPDEIIADKAMVLKHVKDFYRSRGTEKSIRFLIRILFNEDVDFYYPKLDILKVSDGKWFIEKSIKFDGNDTFIDGTANTYFLAIKNAFTGKRITGNTSGATALVERVDTYYENNHLVKELKISNQSRDFSGGETIYALFEEDGQVKSVSTNIYSGIIDSVTLGTPGTRYAVGDRPTITGNTGSGAIVEVSSVTEGGLEEIFVVYGGAGFQNNDLLLITGGGGSGANANIANVSANNRYHPNSYNIIFSTIDLESNTPINNTVYSNLVSAITDPCNAWVSNSMSSFVYGNTGPAAYVTLISGGDRYSSDPSISTLANTRVRAMGILGRMEIINGGLNYANNDKIDIINIAGGYGCGGKANVSLVAANGKIQRVEFESIAGFPVGGCGYDQSFLPTANVRTSTGNGANIIITAILGAGAQYEAQSSTFGEILELRIVSGGSEYMFVPTLDFSDIGDGTATATATIARGIFTYPGRYLNDDSHVSGYNFIQDRDYYQNFSYVVRTKKSIEKYRKYLKDLIHPAGMKLFGEYIVEDIDEDILYKSTQSSNTFYRMIVNGTYTANSITNTNTRILISTTRNVSNVTQSYIEFTSGALDNVVNGIFGVVANNSNSFYVYQVNNNVTIRRANTFGNVYISIY